MDALMRRSSRAPSSARSAGSAAARSAAAAREKRCSRASARNASSLRGDSKSTATSAPAFRFTSRSMRWGSGFPTRTITAARPSGSTAERSGASGSHSPGPKASPSRHFHAKARMRSQSRSIVSEGWRATFTDTSPSTPRSACENRRSRWWSVDGRAMAGSDARELGRAPAPSPDPAAFVAPHRPSRLRATPPGLSRSLVVRRNDAPLPLRRRRAPRARAVRGARCHRGGDARGDRSGDHPPGGRGRAHRSVVDARAGGRAGGGRGRRREGRSGIGAPAPAGERGGGSAGEGGARGARPPASRSRRRDRWRLPRPRDGEPPLPSDVARPLLRRPVVGLHRVGRPGRSRPLPLERRDHADALARGRPPLPLRRVVPREGQGRRAGGHRAAAQEDRLPVRGARPRARARQPAGLRRLATARTLLRLDQGDRHGDLHERQRGEGLVHRSVVPRDLALREGRLPVLAVTARTTIMRTAHAALPLAAALLGACGQPFLSAQLEVPEIRITSPSRSFPATNPTPTDLCAGVAGCLKSDVSYDLGQEVPVLGEKGITFDLRLTDVALRLDSGAADLGGVNAARVILLDAGGGSTLVASYAKLPGATPSSIAVSGNSNIDLGPYLSDGKITARVEIDYDTTNPPPDFTADVEAGFSLVVTLEYDAYF